MLFPVFPTSRILQISAVDNDGEGEGEGGEAVKSLMSIFHMPEQDYYMDQLVMIHCLAPVCLSSVSRVIGIMRPKLYVIHNRRS